MNTISLYEPRTLLEAVKQLMPVHTFLKTTFFKNIRTFVTEKVDVDYYKGRRRMAPFVSPRLAGKVMERQGFRTETYIAPLIKPKRAINVEDISQRSLGENVYTSKSPQQRAIELLADDIEELDQSITRREEWMCAQVLFNGKVVMKGEGVDELLDYNFTNKVVLAGTDKWNDPASDPIADLKAWRQEVIKLSGITPDTVVMASDVVDTFINHPKVKEVLDNLRIKMGQIEPRTLDNAVTFIGSITSLGLDLYSYDEWYYDDETDPANPELKPLVPVGTVLLGSTRAKFSMYYGSVILMNKKTEQFEVYEGERVPNSWVESDPAQRWLQINSRPLPVPHEVESWYVAKVV